MQRLALSCISDCTVFGLRGMAGQEQILTSWERGQPQPNQFRLTTHGGVGELDVRIALNYVVEVVGVQAFAARTTSYQYVASDIAGQQLVIYDWHPTGRSPVISPHLHIPAARTVVLEQREGSPRAGARTHPGALHFPTGPARTATGVDMLIREFGVDPVRKDWERVLGAGTVS
ncbi:MAG: hypothetical protein KC442_23315 [Thermomicrobiales bacterium]|nr:hypothetical protein [Thermomicrobiales bacterium]